MTGLINNTKITPNFSNFSILIKLVEKKKKVTKRRYTNNLIDRTLTHRMEYFN